MHNAAFKYTGYPGVYVAFDVVDAAKAAEGIRCFGIPGASITIPHKVRIMDHIDDICYAARRIGAVNTIITKDGKLYGKNTDAAGAVSALRAETRIKGKHVVILGSGGAARAVAFGVSDAGGITHIVCRNLKKGREITRNIEADVFPFEKLSHVPCDILINTTPVGMYPDVDKSPVDPFFFRPGLVVMDIIYNPVITRFLADAQKAGCRVVSGLSMFVYQGALQFKEFTRLDAPVDVMKNAVLSALDKG